MEAVRDQWTDDRMDDLNHRVDEGFADTKREFQAVRLEMRSEFQAVRLEMRGEFQAVRSELLSLHRTMLQVVLGGFAVTIAGFAGTIATILVQS